ncbi:uncharacterized protein LOC133173419 [Saccostrea echinata]|uniref:uncharacterized protein LOC133173419 n=1 Tax=Saccostrea echinata TaxID=191078 RepID=UPI002A7EDC9C|nr:uncharacterized protein LOC133173419 [Saccostrea echinata]
MTQLIKHRKMVSLVTGSISSAFSIVNIVAMGVSNGVTLKDIVVASDAACVVKSSYGMYTVGTIVELAVTVFVALTIFIQILKKDFYYVNLLSHAIAFLALGSASIVFGVKLNTRITWNFWLGLLGGVLAFGNFLYWFSTQMFRRYLKRHHPDDPIFNVGGDALENDTASYGGQDDDMDYDN